MLRDISPLYLYATCCLVVLDAGVFHACSYVSGKLRQNPTQAYFSVGRQAVCSRHNSIRVGQLPFAEPGMQDAMCTGLG